MPESDYICEWYLDMFSLLRNISDTEVTIETQLLAIKELQLIGSADEFMKVMKALSIEFAKSHKDK